MSSPLAKKNKGDFDKILIAFHRRVSHSSRINTLSDKYVEIIKTLFQEDRFISLLDVGCGDMEIAKAIAQKHEKVRFTCIDIHPNIFDWENYLQFNGAKIPFPDKNFDLTLFSDVLHHDYNHIKNLLMEARRVSDFIIIKDHFEYGIWSRKILQISDFVGNHGYGVSVPEKYLSVQSFTDLLNDCQLKEIKRICPFVVYKKSPFLRVFIKSKYQFISSIKQG